MSLLLVTGLLGSCSSYNPFRSDSGIEEGEWFPVYFGGDQVGEAQFDKEIIEFTQQDRVYRTTVTEKIDFKGDQYQFEFTLIDEVTRITILRYDPQRELYYLSDSYSMVFDGENLKHIYYENDGETVREERVISSPNKVNYARDLFRRVQEFLMGYYGGKIQDKAPGYYHEYDRYQSLGYELLNYDRL